jgi:raffinose/stachyose/melibiose transport system permease protein
VETTLTPVTSVAEQQPVLRRRTFLRRIWRGRLGYAFVCPALAFAAVFLYYPAISALYHSVFDWTGFTSPTFNGIDNFREIVQSGLAQLAALNVLKLTVFSLLVIVTVPLGVARLVVGLPHPRIRYLFRIVFVIPMVVPGVVIFLVWGFFFEPNIGLFNTVLADVGLKALQQDWLGDPHVALYSIMFMGFPWINSLAFLIYTAGLQAISQEILEAAKLDGAGSALRFLRVELPLVLGQIKLMLVLSLVGSIQQFTAILILTDGGPANQTMVPGLLLYNEAFQYSHMGYASAIGSLMFLVILGVTVLNLTYIRSETEYRPGAD